MKFFEIIDKKKKGEKLNYDEYLWFINSLVNNEIPDYQSSALLMALYINGMSDDELFAFTKAIIDTSDIIEPKANNFLNISIDKHSSGGIGDKVSLILSPILVALGYDVVKLSGRGLSFTGGTIDKLESIGICYEYNKDTFQDYLTKTNLVLMLQTQKLVPGDKKLYSLRDVTGTVDSLPLIAASIMAKKLIIKSDYIFLDIKVGSGAFLKTVEEAKRFSELVLKISKYFNRKTIIHLTDMSQPLGSAVGNAIEVKEAVEFLQGNFHSKLLKELIFEFAAEILIDTKICETKEIALQQIENVIENGKAYNAFVNFVKTFSSNPNLFLEDKYFAPNFKIDIYANQSGYLSFSDVKELGIVAIFLGAGRLTKEDKLDYSAGIKLYFEPNQYVENGTKIATLYSDKEISNETIQKFESILNYSKEKSIEHPIILGKAS